MSKAYFTVVPVGSVTGIDTGELPEHENLKIPTIQRNIGISGITMQDEVGGLWTVKVSADGSLYTERFDPDKDE